MPMLTALVLATTPAFEPVREHTWGEPIEIAFEIESAHTDSEPASRIVQTEFIGTDRMPFLHYTFNTPAPFEFVALNFESSRLTGVLYPLHLPASEAHVEKPDTDVPEKFRAVRAWLNEHLGEPDVFTTTVASHTADFADVESLLELDAYTFNYTWCSRAANAYLVALRETGKSPVVVASLAPPDSMPRASITDSPVGCGKSTGLAENR